jgi:hypothetical protein
MPEELLAHASKPGDDEGPCGPAEELYISLKLDREWLKFSSSVPLSAMLSFQPATALAICNA